jgi:hypothetical protein
MCHRTFEVPLHGDVRCVEEVGVNIYAEDVFREGLVDRARRQEGWSWPRWLSLMDLGFWKRPQAATARQAQRDTGTERAERLAPALIDRLPAALCRLVPLHCLELLCML